MKIKIYSKYNEIEKRQKNIIHVTQGMRTLL